MQLDIYDPFDSAAYANLPTLFAPSLYNQA